MVGKRGIFSRVFFFYFSPASICSGLGNGVRGGMCMCVYVCACGVFICLFVCREGAVPVGWIRFENGGGRYIIYHEPSPRGGGVEPGDGRVRKVFATSHDAATDATRRSFNSLAPAARLRHSDEFSSHTKKRN